MYKLIRGIRRISNLREQIDFMIYIVLFLDVFKLSHYNRTINYYITKYRYIEAKKSNSGRKFKYTDWFKGNNHLYAQMIKMLTLVTIISKIIPYDTFNYKTVNCSYILTHTTQNVCKSKTHI